MKYQMKYEEWFYNTYPGWYSVKLHNGNRKWINNPIDCWIMDNCNFDWEYENDHYFFKNEDDALLFALKWL